MEIKSQFTCSICTRNTASYSCPRCSINYCSLACYRDRRHEKCSEQFYKECCTQAAKDLRSDDSNRQQIEMLLKENDNFRNEYYEVEDEGDSEEDSEPDELSARYVSTHKLHQFRFVTYVCGIHNSRE